MASGAGGISRFSLIPVFALDTAVRCVILLMIVAIADTHTTIWYLFSDPRLGKAASAFIDDTITKGDHIGVSAISRAEMVYLIEKGRIPASALDDLHAAISDPRAVLQHVPFDENIAMKMREVPPPGTP